MPDVAGLWRAHPPLAVSQGAAFTPAAHSMVAGAFMEAAAVEI
jgi:hypothetical protein